MPDLQNFSIVRTGTASLTVPVWTVSGQICDSSSGAVLRDFTGGNAVSFPQVLGSLSQTQQDEFVQTVILWLLQKRFGV